jgi:tripartite-type tricarboxylate transporter receptor subunit TctC
MVEKNPCMLSLSKHSKPFFSNLLGLQRFLLGGQMAQKPSLSAFVILAVFIGCAPLFAQSQPYFQGKTIMLIQGREPGGTGALRAQAAIPFLRKYLPGEPIIVTQFMPGGGGRKASNYIYHNAKPDGLTFGNVGSGLIANAVLGSTGVEYDIDKFVYLGAANSTAQYVFGTWSKLGLDNLDKLRARSGLRIGAQTVGHDIYINGRLFSWLLGLRDPKFVTGYSGPEVDLAMSRGEIDGRANIPDTILQRSPEFIEKKLVNYHAIIQIPKEDRHPHPLFNKLPELETFARADRERKIMTMFRTFRLVGSPYILPPGTPAEIANQYREAMRKTFKDPAFIKEFKKLTADDATPLLPEAQEKAIRDIPRDPEVIALFNKLAGAEPLPPR